MTLVEPLPGVARPCGSLAILVLSSYRHADKHETKQTVLDACRTLLQSHPLLRVVSHCFSACSCCLSGRFWVAG